MVDFTDKNISYILAAFGAGFAVFSAYMGFLLMNRLKLLQIEKTLKNTDQIADKSHG